MTRKARIVLEDCELAIRRHSSDLQGNELRISWVAIISLLRAIGHVLRNVDSFESCGMKQAISEWWENVKRSKPAIFFDFIEAERNNVLKVYQLGFRRTMTIPGPLFKGEETFISVDWSEMRGGRLEAEDAEISSWIIGGPFQGRDEREVASEACRWWRDQLDWIDGRAEEIQSDAKEG